MTVNEVVERALGQKVERLEAQLRDVTAERDRLREALEGAFVKDNARAVWDWWFKERVRGVLVTAGSVHPLVNPLHDPGAALERVEGRG